MTLPFCYSKGTPSKWAYRWLCLAEQVSSWSKDPATKVGAVIARDKHIVSLGYNGFPENVFDDPLKLENRDLKYLLSVHAEMNALNSATQKLENTQLYLYPLLPCSSCALHIVNAKISEVYVNAPLEIIEERQRWFEEWEKTIYIFEQSNVKLTVFSSPFKNMS